MGLSEMSPAAGQAEGNGSVRSLSQVPFTLTHTHRQSAVPNSVPQKSHPSGTWEWGLIWK